MIKDRSATLADENLPPIRWGAFLRASVYANPLVDFIERIVYKMENGKIGPDYERVDATVRIDETEIRVVSPETDDLIFSLDEVSDVRIQVGGLAEPGMNSGQGTLEFNYRKSPVSLPFWDSSSSLLKFVKFLLDHRIPYREYVAGGRTHLFQYLSYAEIQEAKRKYGIKW